MSTDKSAAAIREFAEKWCLKVIEVMKGDDYIMRDLDGCLSDLTALISEHYYPKEFLLWTHSQDYWLFDSLTCLWVSDEPSAFQEEKTTDELFNYWEENVSSQKTEGGE